MSASIAAAVLALPLATAAVVPAGAAAVSTTAGSIAAAPTAGRGWSPDQAPYSSYSPYSPYWSDPQQFQASPYARTSTAALDASDATAEQSSGLALISTTVDFGAGEAAGPASLSTAAASS